MTHNIEFKQVYESSGPKFKLIGGELVKVKEASGLELVYESHPGQTSAQVLEDVAKQQKSFSRALPSTKIESAQRSSRIEISFQTTITDKDGEHYYPFLALDPATGQHLTKEEVLAREPDSAVLFAMFGV
jgi:hypothetical protein